MSERVLVTGSSGFLGGHVVAALRARGDEVVEVPHRWASPDDLAATVGEGPLERAVHLAWSTGPRFREDASANLASFAASLEIVELLAVRGCRHAVVVGTGAEYRPADRPHAEDDALGPQEVYSALKAALSRLLTGPSSPAPFTVAWARLFTPLGPGDISGRLVPTVMRAVLHDEPIELTDCAQHVEVLDVADASSGLVALLDRCRAGTWNIASGTALVLRDVLETLVDSAGDRSLLRFGARSRDPWTRDWYVGDSTRLRVDTGWSPAYDLDATLARVSEDWRDRCLQPGTAGTS